MSTHKHIDRVCAAVLALTLILTVLFIQGKSLGLEAAPSALGYEARLFDAGRVHTIDLRMEDWEGFLETCTNEEYQLCSLTIDGEAVESAAIRAKGNTSLTSVAAYGNDRYSFKVEFDHYDGVSTYHGLDKLSLNNLIQDNTCMKDFLVYRLMAAFGAAAPLCSYVWLTVNGEPWGLYLAVEGIEDAFLERNYGSAGGNLYKPDSMSFGGGRGNGREFRMEAFERSSDDGAENRSRFTQDAGEFPLPSPPDNPAAGAERNSSGKGDMTNTPGGFGMGSDDVKLRYIDDNPDSYSNIFQNAKTDVSKADQTRLIASLKSLSEGKNLENILDMDEVLRYFVVHNFVRNGDSYTGSMVHNYYLYEEEGRLSMIPWDYGTFQGGDADSEVNAPIDSPVSGGDSRPMVDWIFDSPAYTALYHQYFQEFLETVDSAALIAEAESLIAPYVEKDPTRFYTYEEFETGVETLRTFCRLRSASIAGQLNGTIPSTEEGQAADASALIDASSITLSDMGTMDRGGGSADRASPPGDSPGEREAQASAGPPGLSDQEHTAIPATEAQTAEILRQGPPEGPGANGFPGGAFLSESPTAISGSDLFLTAVSLTILLTGILTAFLFRRRKG